MLAILLLIFLASTFDLLNDQYIECLMNGGGLYCWAIDQSAKNLLALVAILVTCGIGIIWYILSSEHT
ncbi:hypothetical protein CUJ83_11825 [Methanocella sp. CWC-04]|uniref:Uncharacterized protein n=2 Tax=Methanooceanicella nereidis TaxID=2052831 RepID=A0AAP2RF49_9EURY|nr:hypothetical protein [Methanocella sp. CWC-04]